MTLDGVMVPVRRSCRTPDAEASAVVRRAGRSVQQLGAPRRGPVATPAAPCHRNSIRTIRSAMVSPPVAPGPPGSFPLRGASGPASTHTVATGRTAGSLTAGSRNPRCPRRPGRRHHREARHSAPAVCRHRARERRAAGRSRAERRDPDLVGRVGLSVGPGVIGHRSVLVQTSVLGLHGRTGPASNGLPNGRRSLHPRASRTGSHAGVIPRRSRSPTPPA